MRSEEDGLNEASRCNSVKISIVSNFGERSVLFFWIGDLRVGARKRSPSKLLSVTGERIHHSASVQK